MYVKKWGKNEINMSLEKSLETVTKVIFYLMVLYS